MIMEENEKALEGQQKRVAAYAQRLLHGSILSEKDYQHFIMDRLSQDNGYVIRKATSYDRFFAVDREMLFQFLNDTQPDEMAALRKIYKGDLEDTIVSFINAEATKARGSLLDVLKHGIELSNMKLELMYTKPATTFNRELLAKYEKNIFSVMEEVWASDNERIDLVIFLNGLAIMSFELKCNAAGQSYQDAIYQYRVDRDPKTRLFWFKAGCIVNFAMDLEQVYMTTKLNGNSTFFLPFNMGNGEGVNAGAGNPTYEDKYSVSYMWEDILTKDTVLDLLSKFVIVHRMDQVHDTDQVFDLIRLQVSDHMPVYALRKDRGLIADLLDLVLAEHIRSAAKRFLQIRDRFRFADRDQRHVFSPAAAPVTGFLYIFFDMFQIITDGAHSDHLLQL